MWLNFECWYRISHRKPGSWKQNVLFWTTFWKGKLIVTLAFPSCAILGEDRQKVTKIVFGSKGPPMEMLKLLSSKSSLLPTEAPLDKTCPAVAASRAPSATLLGSTPPGGLRLPLLLLPHIWPCCCPKATCSLSLPPPSALLQVSAGAVLAEGGVRFVSSVPNGSPGGGTLW